MWIVTAIPFKTGVSDGYDEPSSPAHDRGYDGPQSVALDPAILHLCGRQVQSAFQSSTGSAGHGGCPCISAASDSAKVLMVTHQSGRAHCGSSTASLSAKRRRSSGSCP